MADGSQITVVAKPQPFSGDVIYAECKAGQTLAQILGSNVSRTAQVTVGGYPVPRELWAHVKPKPLSTVHVALFPQGGNAGKWIRIIAIVVISYFTFGAGSAAAAAWLGVSTGTLAVIGMVAILAVNALIPPPTPKMDGPGGGDPFNQLASITGTSNRANPYGVIPCVVGQLRFFPPHAALPYTEISGDDQYLRMLLDLGYGDLDISDIQIGETAIESYEDVDYEITTTPTLFCQDIYELSVGTALNTNGDTATRTTQTNVTEISLDLVGGQGVFGVDAKGNSVTGTIGFTILYRQTGSGSWTPIASASGLTLTGGLSSGGGSVINLTSGARKTYRGGVRWKVAAGQYDVMITRTTAHGIGFPGAVDVNSVIDQISWTVLRSISPQNPSTSGTLKLALRIKATDQLNGIVSNLSVLAGQRIRQWDSVNGVWTAPGVSQNPAWIRLWLLTQCPAVARPLTDDRVDVDSFAAWAADCDTLGYVTSFMMDSGRALGDIDADVLAAGRAAFGMRNGQYAVIRDVQQTVPVQMFTPANSSGFSYSRSFLDLPHALRVNFTNPEANYQADVVVVYADGYSADGSGGTTKATRFEQLDAKQVVDPAAAWRLGKYHLSVAYNRPTQYNWTADIEQLVCERGDMVTNAHDITGWGVAWGRIKAVAGAVVTIDGPVTLEAGKTYVFRDRRDDLLQVTQTISSADGVIVTLAGAIAGMQPGDLYEIGVVNQGVANLLITKIEPGNDLSATLTAVDAAPDVWTSDSGAPPPFVSDITGKAWCAVPDPPQLNLIVTGAPNDSGAFNQGGGISIPPQGGILRGGGGGSGGGAMFNGRRTISLL